jgi:hypothetical protein
MELNVTQIVAAHLDGNPPAHLCSGSMAELGNDAGRVTWDNSCDLADRLPGFLETEDALQEVRDHIKSYGAWDEEEIAAFTPRDLRAFIVQEVMAEIRHLEEHGQIDLEDFTEEEFREADRKRRGTPFPWRRSGIPRFRRLVFLRGILNPVFPVRACRVRSPASAGGVAGKNPPPVLTSPIENRK